MTKISNGLTSKVYRTGAVLLLWILWALLLFQLNDAPPGFQHDQMFNSLDALSIGGDNYPLYFPANFGREPLGIYPFGLTFQLLGKQHIVWGLRFTTVMWSLAALCLTMTLARRYLRRGGALLASALLAGSFWFIFNARLGLEPVVLMALATAVIYFLNRGLDTRAWRDFIAAGVIGGLAIYTYLASRGLFGLLALLLGYEILRQLLRRIAKSRPIPKNQGSHSSPRYPPPATRSPIPGLMATLMLMTAISAPLLIYLQTRPATADLRVGELGRGAATAALAGDLRPLLGNVRETTLAVLWSGPASLPYHYNVPGRPVLQPLLAIFFLIGLGLTLLRLRRSTEFLLVAALFVGLLPDFVTGADALHMRGVIALPLIFILVARGLWATGSLTAAKLAQRGSERSLAVWSRLAAVALAAVLAWHAVDSSRAYFVDWAQAEPVQRIYNADWRAVAAYLDEHPTDDPVIIGTDRLVDLDQMTYALYEPRRQDAAWFPAADALPLPTAGRALYFLPTSVDAPSPSWALLVDAARDRLTLPGPGGRYDLVQGVQIAAEDVDGVLRSANAQPLEPQPIYGESLRLDAAGARQRGAALDLLTRWTVVGPWPHATPAGQPRQPIKLSAALVDTSGYKWAQVDVDSHLPFNFWQPGEVYLALAQLPLPADLPPGDYTVRLALYDDIGGAVAVHRNALPAAADAAVAAIQVTSPVAGTPSAPPSSVEPSVSGDKLRLLGRWESLDFLVAGVPVDVRISWQAEQPLATAGLRFRLQARAADGSVFWDQDVAPLQRLPATWPAQQAYRLTHRLQPQALPAGVDAARLELCALQGGIELACGAVGQSQIIEQSPVTALPAPPEVASGANWDGQLTLSGYDLDQDGERSVLTLYWQVAAAPAMPLKRFVHALDSDGQIVAQADAVPTNGALLMPYWRTGEYVVDQVRLIAAGSQALVQAFCVGLYEPETGQRVPVYLPSGEMAPDSQYCLPSE